jgi:hypothetical protein
MLAWRSSVINILFSLIFQKCEEKYWDILFPLLMRIAEDKETWCPIHIAFCQNMDVVPARGSYRIFEVRYTVVLFHKK